MMATPHSLVEVATLSPDPVGLDWSRQRWLLTVSSCVEFERLARTLPTDPAKRWLNGDRTHVGTTVRYWMVEGDGAINHVCTGKCDPAPEPEPDLFADGAA